jgi:DNA-binding GntR family transcriptional regulator
MGQSDQTLGRLSLPTNTESEGSEQSLEHRAYAALLDWLLGGEVKPGQPIPIREFARRLGMSRTPVRTAVGRLHEQGLAAYNPQIGFTTAIPTITDLYEFFDLRLMYETYALRRFFEHPNRKLPEDIPHLAEEMWALPDQIVDHPERYREFWERDRRFHRGIVVLGRNCRLLESYDQLNVHIHFIRVNWMPLTLERFRKAAAEHFQIVKAIQEGHSDAACRLVEAHITRARDQTVLIAHTTPSVPPLGSSQSEYVSSDQNMGGTPNDAEDRNIM